MSLLTERMAALRERNNTSPISEAKQPTTLANFLRIYNKAGTECYINYMEGAKALLKYLAPIDIPVIGEYLLPIGMPGLFHAYEVGALASLFYPVELVQVDGMDTEEYFAKHRYLVKLIIHLTCKDYS